MIWNLGLFLAVAFLAYANGANDNFKGVATLFGSGTTDYRRALGWATLTTFAGSLLSLVLAGGLVHSFSGKGLVPDAVAGSPLFLAAVALGAGGTVLLATWAGFPISTTHALTGALLGSGLASIGSGVDFTKLGKAFFLPLAASPLMAFSLAAVAYLIFREIRKRIGMGPNTCLCLEPTKQGVAIQSSNLLTCLLPAPPRLVMGTGEACSRRYQGNIMGIQAQLLVDGFHFLSAGLVGFARGLNDTPKLVALLLGSTLLGLQTNLALIALAMAVGGILGARKVALTLSRKITPMNSGQGFTANLVTAVLVTVASRIGLPVSTTHVSVGALSGIGLVTGQGNPRVILQIMLSWLLTLPVGALIGYAVFLGGSRL